MLTMILPREFKALGGIAVAAAEQAGVVHADISAYGTSAFLALGWVFFRGSVVFEERFDQIVVYTFSRQDIQFGHIEVFGATLQCYPIGGGFIDQIENEILNIGNHKPLTGLNLYLILS